MKAAVGVLVVKVCGVFIFLCWVWLVFVDVLTVAACHIMAEVELVWFGFGALVFWQIFVAWDIIFRDCIKRAIMKLNLFSNFLLSSQYG